MFFSTHITSDLDKIADRLVMIHNGKIAFEADKSTLLKDGANFEEVMLRYIEGSDQLC